MFCKSESLFDVFQLVQMIDVEVYYIDVNLIFHFASSREYFNPSDENNKALV